MCQPAPLRAATERWLRTWVNTSRVPSPSGCSSKRSSSLPHVNENTVGGSKATTRPVSSGPSSRVGSPASWAAARWAPSSKTSSDPTERSPTTSDGNQADSSDGSVTARHTRSMPCG